jgi:hypothetical protein
MSCGDEGDELLILPIAVIDLVSLLAFFPRSRTFWPPCDIRRSTYARPTGRERALPDRGL